MMSVHEILIEDIRSKVIECGIHRILACVEKLDLNQLNYRPNDNSNSINNQILHLDGNVRQWLIASFSSAKDNRLRDAEFDPDNRKEKTELVRILKTLESDVLSSLPRILEVDLAELKDVQCYTQTNLSIIIHVIEHFSYHVGQITYITKMLLDIDTGYYEDLNLNEVN